MKKSLFLFALMTVLVSACNDGLKKNDADVAEANRAVDSLSRSNQQLERELDMMLSIYNDVAESMQSINEAQGRVIINQRAEGDNRRRLIQEDMRYIQETLAENKALIQKLRDQLQQGNIKSQQLQRTINDLMSQLETKNAEIQKLRAELEAKDIHIAELDERVASLTENIGQLNEDVGSLQDVNAQQDQQLHAAWYAIGSKSELKQYNILKDGRVLEGEFDASYFNQVDIRQLSTLPLHSKKVEILTTHPADSYNLVRDDNKLYTLQILDPQRFWSTSKYLVIQVK